MRRTAEGAAVAGSSGDGDARATGRSQRTEHGRRQQQQVINVSVVSPLTLSLPKFHFVPIQMLNCSSSQVFVDLLVYGL